MRSLPHEMIVPISKNQSYIDNYHVSSLSCGRIDFNTTKLSYANHITGLLISGVENLYMYNFFLVNTFQAVVYLHLFIVIKGYIPVCTCT